MRIAILLSVPMLLLLQAGALDVVHLKSGGAVQGKIAGFAKDQVYMKVVVRGKEGSGSSRRTIPLGKVAFIDFEPVAADEALLASPSPERLQEIIAVWQARKRHLGRPNSSAGAFALAAARLHVAEGSPLGARRALVLYDAVIAGDWNDARRITARQGRLRALMVSGEVDQAMEEADQLGKSAAEPAVQIEARYILALGSLAKLKELDVENPRWEDDDEIRPQRELLFHEVLDRFLYPYLFYGSREEEAARGLWGAIEVYLYANAKVQAVRCAEDIVALYPDSAYAEHSRQLLARKDPSHDDP